MNDKRTGLLSHRALNGWRLFWLVSLPMSALVVLESTIVDLNTPSGVSAMIGFAVRIAVPLLYLVVAASAVYALFPGTTTAWWLRNRKYIGMCFAVAMCWQGLFIATLSVFHREYYFDEVFLFRDELEGSTGYIFLAAMVVTSFEFCRKYLDQRQWKFLHRFSMYYLWAYPFSTYWWNLYYYENPELHDYIYFWTGFLAVALRIAAWGKKRYGRVMREQYGGPSAIGAKMLGGGLVMASLIVAATGLRWQDTATTWLTGPAWSANLELWLPYWPFEPFFAHFLLAVGVMVMTSSSTRRITFTREAPAANR